MVRASARPSATCSHVKARLMARVKEPYVLQDSDTEVVVCMPNQGKRNKVIWFGSEQGFVVSS